MSSTQKEIKIKKIEIAVTELLAWENKAKDLKN